MEILMMCPYTQGFTLEHEWADIRGLDMNVKDLISFTTISAEDSYNLYRSCDFGVTNYSHVGYEFFLLKKPIVSYGMKYTNEWKFVDDLCENVYTDIFSKDDLKSVILNGGFNINFREEYANKFFVERSGLAYKRIDSSIRSYLY